MINKKLYICFTFYHVLVTLMKEISSDYTADIVICDTIPEYEGLIDSLKDSGIFNNVYEFKEKKYQESGFLNFKRFIRVRNLFVNQIIKKNINPSFELKKSTYSEVNIFNDWTYIGYYLRANKIYYNLLEDAKDSYKVLGNYFKIDYYKPFKHRLLSRIFETQFFHGKSKYSKVVEVNSADGISIPKDKLRITPKDNMFKNLTNEDKIKIYNIFMSDKVSPTLEQNSILILTQPLFEDKIVKFSEIQKNVYEIIINEYCIEKGLNPVIKPHPRDNFNYELEFSNIKVINKNLPTEILNFNPQIKFAKAITVTSSSIGGIDFVDEKISLGFEWLRQFQ
ncbi:MAG: hypothetical protein K0S51_1289 [Bacillales bacterium]|jgi:hypothetical protein|nr:hypothetical protein [Bacillales bacterium]